MGNDLLSTPHDSDDPEPDFVPELKSLQARLDRVAPTPQIDLDDSDAEPDTYDPDLEIPRA